MKIKLILLLLALTSFAFVIKQSLPLGSPPKELPAIDTSLTKLTWNSIVEAHYKVFSNDYKYSADSSIATRELTVAIFGAISEWAEYNKQNLPNGFRNPLVYKMIVKKFYNSPNVRLAIYKWVKPFYIEAFKKLPSWKKNIIRRMLKHAKLYISQFDLIAETKVLKESKRDFWYHGPKGKRGDFRRMEAFIFRRVYNKDMTLEQMLAWVDIIQKDINSVK